ncbi:MAG TPA: proline/glycine betaine ABC transporter permease [Bacillales bacterium]|nr:proline/glycine betaine ABC transporter permease [Bacillales bacterium]
MQEQLFPKIPLGHWIDLIVQYLEDHLLGLFNVIRTIIETIDGWLVWFFSIGPPYLWIVVIALIAWWLVGWKSGLLTLIGLWLVNNLGYWSQLIDTLALVIMSVIIAIIIGIPVGIWMSQKDTVRSVITPILDFMQTMPAFVYLIPSVIFFHLGVAPGVIATVIFSMPPTVRLTNLGIRQVPEDLIEAANAFGSTTGQRLRKVQIPLAIPTLMAGINQSIMLSLSMVVIASLVGAPGLGTVVYRAVTQVDVGTGFEGGLALVIIAMVLDRISQNVKKKKTD